VSGNADEKVAEAKFFSPVAGSVFLRWVGSHHSGSTDTLLHANLYHVVGSTGSRPTNTEHHWKIYTTDILDSEAGIAELYKQDCTEIYFSLASIIRKKKHKLMNAVIFKPCFAVLLYVLPQL
jgi:hypothetical protein